MSFNVAFRYDTLSRGKFTPLENSNSYVSGGRDNHSTSYSEGKVSISSFLTGFTCNGKAAVKNGEFWLTEAQDLIRGFYGALEFDEKNIYFRNTTFNLANSSYQLSGSINDYLRQAFADLKIKSAVLDLADLSILFPGTDLPTWGLTGKGKLLISAVGPLAGLKFLTETEIAAGKIKGVPFSDFILQANWQHNLLTVKTCQAKLAGGDLDLSAKIRLEAKRSLEIYEMNASWLKVNIAEFKAKNFTGIFDGYMTMKGSWPEVEAKGRVTAQKINYANYELGPMDASFQYQRHKLSFSGLRVDTKDKLRGSVEFRDKFMQINNLGVDFVKGGSISVRARCRRSQANQWIWRSPAAQCQLKR